MVILIKSCQQQGLFLFASFNGEKHLVKRINNKPYAKTSSIGETTSQSRGKCLENFFLRSTCRKKNMGFKMYQIFFNKNLYFILSFLA